MVSVNAEGSIELKVKVDVCLKNCLLEDVACCSKSLGVASSAPGQAEITLDCGGVNGSKLLRRSSLTHAVDQNVKLALLYEMCRGVNKVDVMPFSQAKQAN